MLRRCRANERAQSWALLATTIALTACSAPQGLPDHTDVAQDATALDDRASDHDAGDVTSDRAVLDVQSQSDSAQSVLSDGWVSGDGGHFECAMAADCEGRVPSDEPFAGMMRWSCIAGRCTYELGGGRTCDFARGLGCVRCLGIPEESCPGALCTPDGLAFEQLRTERASRCGLSLQSPVPVRDCFNGIVRLSDGSLCTLSEAPTGAIRYVLSCGGCAATLVPR
jgi:hypothetical protein